VVGGLWSLKRPTPPARKLLGCLGLVLVAFTAWLLLQQRALHSELLVHNPMTVPAMGPGLWIALGGSLLIVLASLRAVVARRLRVRAMDRP